MARKKRNRKSSAAVRRERRQQEKSSGFTGTTLSLPEGVTFLEIDSDDTRKLVIVDYVVGKGNPYAEPGSRHYERTYYIHRNVGVDENSYVCPKKTFGKPCPVCEDFDKLRKTEDWDDVKEMKPKQRQLFVAKELGEDDWHVWDVSTFLFGEQLDYEVDNAEDSEYDFFSDWEDGLYLRVAFEEKHFGSNQFYAAKSINFKEREDLTEEEIAKIPCLDEMIVEYPYDKLKAIYDGESCEEEEEEQKEEKKEEKKEPEKKPSSRRKKKEPEPEPEESEDDFDDDFDEEFDDDFDD